MVLQAIYSLASVVIEFPSGYLADRLGYRTALFIGAASWVVGWMLYASAATFDLSWSRFEVRRVDLRSCEELTRRGHR